MKTIFTLFVSILCSLSHSDAQTGNPDEEEVSRFVELRRKWKESGREKWLEAQTARGKVIAEREKKVSSLRADLSAPWSALIVATRTDCSCTGTSYTGLRIIRGGDHSSAAPWMERESGDVAAGGKEYTGAAQQVTGSAVEKLVAETVLFYLAATISESVVEKVGKWPSDAQKQAEWWQRYLAAGGSPEGGDRYSIDIRVVTPDGVKRYSDMWERGPPSDFSAW